MNNTQDTEAKYAADTFPQFLGIKMEKVATGYARVSMYLQENMLNFHGIGHGGAIFTLADTALGLASNSHDRQAVALSVTINYLTPARPGMELTAVAEEEHLTRRTAIYRIAVTGSNGKSTDKKNIALAQGTVYRK